MIFESFERLPSLFAILLPRSWEDSGAETNFFKTGGEEGY
jgi:hypothetical protein